MTGAIHARIKENGVSDRAVAEVLFAVVQDEDDSEEYYNHINQSGSNVSGSCFS